MGEAGLRTLLKAYADGADDSNAFTRAFGRSIDDVEASFKTFVDQRYGALREAMRVPKPEVNPDDLAGLRARAQANPGNFNVDSLTRTDSLYFTVTVFATVGFGDITATSQVARVAVIVQMLLDLLVLGLVVKVFLGAVEKGRGRQKTVQDPES